MREEQGVVSRRFLGLGVILCGLALIALLCFTLVGTRGSAKADALITKYRVSPDWESRQALANLLSFHDLPPSKARDVLDVLLRPEVDHRTRYAKGKPACVFVRDAAPHANVYGYAVESLTRFAVDGREVSAGSTGPAAGGALGLGGGGGPLPNLAPGAHKVTVSMECKLWPLEGPKVPVNYYRPDRPWPFRFLPMRTWVVEKGKADTTKPAKYHWQKEVSFDIEVVPDAEAERVALVTDAETDAVVRAAITVSPSSIETITRGNRRLTMNRIEVKKVPVDLVLRGEYRDEAGKVFRVKEPTTLTVRRRETPTQASAIVLLPLNQYPEPLQGYPVGKNKGTLVLTPDPHAAYLQPDIKAIWGGTLELPIEFTVLVNGAADGADSVPIDVPAPGQ